MPNLTKEQFIERARAVHGDKYDYSKVEYVDTKTKVCIICPEHGEFWQRAGNHMSGIGCPKCGIEKATSKIRIYTKEKCKEFSRQYTSPSLFKNGNQTAYNVALRNGWLKDFTWLNYKIKQSQKRERTTYTQSSMLQRLNLTFGDRYDYSLVEYHAMKTPITLICHRKNEDGKEHGEFSMRPDNLFSGNQGCPKCAITRRISLQTKPLEDFIQQARQVHGDKYDYSKVNYINTNTKVAIICPIHGVFMQIPSNHLKGKGCPHCAGNAKQWNKETCLEAAKKYKYVADYRRLCPSAYNVALRKGWLLDYVWLKHLPPKYDDYISNARNIYAYEFKHEKYVYVGLTNSIKRRDWAHRHGKSGSAVYKFAQSKGIEVPTPIILEKNIPTENSGERENYWVLHYAEEGWNLLNKAKTGCRASSLGSLANIKWNKKRIMAAAKECDYNLTRFMQEYWTAYYAMLFRYRYLLDELFPTRSVHTYHTIEEAIAVAKSESFKNRTVFSKKYPWAHRILFKAKLLDYIFGRPKEYTKEEALKEAKKYRSIERIRCGNHSLWTFLKNNNLFKEAKPTDPMFRRCKTIEDAWELSLYYKNMTDLSNHARTAYRMLRDANLLRKRFPDSRKFKKEISK